MQGLEDLKKKLHFFSRITILHSYEVHWSLFPPPGIILKTIHSARIYVFCKFLNAKNDYFLYKINLQVFTTKTECWSCRRKWVFKYNPLYSLLLQGHYLYISHRLRPCPTGTQWPQVETHKLRHHSQALTFQCATARSGPRLLFVEASLSHSGSSGWMISPSQRPLPDNKHTRAVLWRRPGFDPGSVHMGFVVDKVALGQVFLRVLRFSPVNFIPPVLHY
jgi:hypothetical protein